MNKLKGSDQQCNQDSGNTEWYTPPKYTEAARQVMGEIDLDPASSKIANKMHKATKIFTKAQNGLNKTWKGRVFMNHPFGKGEKACKTIERDGLKHYKCSKNSCVKRGYHIDEDVPGNGVWINKILKSYRTGKVEEAIILTFASTSEGWFIPLLDHKQCFVRGRINFIDINGKVITGAPKGAVFTYLGDNPARFALVFGKFGKVK